VAELPDFQKKQYAFAAHIRDPDNNPPPADIEDRRMAVYRELFFNNLLKLLSGTFPVLKKLHTADQWRAMIRQFMVSHHAQTPYFLEIPKEFLAFLEHEYESDAGDFPFLLELAHYEWAELALTVSEESNDDLSVDTEADLLAGIPVKSRLAWQLAYRFPVHRISESFQPLEADAQPTFLVIHRSPEDDLGFMELNPVTARLLELIADNSENTGADLVNLLAAEINYSDTDALMLHAQAAMDEMRAAHILLGAAAAK
jgi:hypothetical protein